MNTLLTFDIGNSHPHVGVHSPHLIGVYSLGHFRDEILPTLKDYSYTISQVGRKSEIFSLLNSNFIDLRTHFKNQYFFQMPINYAQTIGDDRLFGSAYIWQQLKNENATSALFIDAGTFTTYDFVELKAGHLGGVIAPGAATFLYNYARGEQLKIYKTSDLNIGDTSLPLDTKSAILTGAHWYLKGIITEALKQRNVDVIYLSGGESETFLPLIQSLTKTRVVTSKHLLHEAMKTLAGQIGH